MIELLALDADDTLWHSQNHFDDAQQAALAVVDRWADADTFAQHLLVIERANISSYGFGVKSFTLSMIEAAIKVSEGTIEPDAISTLLNIGKDLHTHPIELIDGVEETVRSLSADHTMVLVTKGDLRHQQQKIDDSGLAHLFDHTRIVEDKNPALYKQLAAEFGVEPRRAMMVGNSLPSDVLPALDAGLHAVHLPYHLIWSYEEATTAPKGVNSLESIRDLPEHINSLKSRAGRSSS